MTPRAKVGPLPRASDDALRSSPDLGDVAFFICLVSAVLALFMVIIIAIMVTFYSAPGIAVVLATPLLGFAGIVMAVILTRLKEPWLNPRGSSTTKPPTTGS